MKRVIFLLALLSGASSALAERVVDTAVLASGGTYTHINIKGEMTFSVEYVISGSPATASITVQGCQRGGTCTLLDAKATTASEVRGFSGLYDQYLISATFTGGSSPAVAVNWTGVTTPLARTPKGLTVVSTPAGGSAATASIAAATDGSHHVADMFCFSAAATTAPSLTAFTINLRDGATGAGTVLVSLKGAFSATTGTILAPFCAGPFQLPGSANTAMTAEFAGGAANVLEAITLFYHDVPQ